MIAPTSKLLACLSLLLCMSACTSPTGGRGLGLDPDDSDPIVDEGTSMIGDPNVSGGETGSMGTRECFSDDECLALASEQVDGLTEPLVLDRALIGSECVARDEQASERCCYHAPAVCLCYYGWNGDTTRDYGNAQVLGNRADCDVYGRANDCLALASDFEGCQPEDEDSCTAACDAVDARLTADLARNIDAEVRSASCNDSGACRNVVRIEQRCFAQVGPAQNSYDCALSDGEILELAYPDAATAQCDENECDAGSAQASSSSSEGTPSD